MSWNRELDELARRKAMAEEMGGADKVKRQHDGGRLTVRERIDRLVDERQLPRGRRASSGNGRVRRRTAS